MAMVTVNLKSVDITFMNRKHKSKNNGLVISSKTVRNQTGKGIGIDEVTESSNKLHQAEKVNPGRKTYELELSPASIRVKKNDAPKTKSVNYVSRKPITKWSKKSRSNMVARLCSLDYSPLFREDLTPVFVTLTYPKTWQVVVPDATSAKRHLALLRKRFDRKYGLPLYGLWKAEFQRRKAIHFHLLTAIPGDVSSFREWLSETWAEVVNHPDEKEKNLHRLAGVGVDKAAEFLVNEPHLVSVYFSKHSSANEGVKEYQNQPPDEWVSAGQVGRFWGYWNLKPAVVSTAVSYETAVFVSRVLRNWNRSKGQVTKKVVWRTNTKTGVIYKRKVNRRSRRLNHTRGFIAVADGPALGALLADAIIKCRAHPSA